MTDLPAIYREAQRSRQIAWIAQSHARLLGKPLVTSAVDPVLALWEDPRPILAHGTEADPVFFFGNRAALTAFECDVDTFVTMPSRLSAEAPLREERQALLDRVRRNGFIDDYAGMRISARGRRFPIRDALVFELSDPTGARAGQAAVFAV